MTMVKPILPCLWVIFLALFLLTVGAEEESESEDSEYLYHGRENFEIIQDYQGNEDSTPRFLYTPVQTPRIVEFYAPWCPHCQHFRSHYVDFAEQMADITAEYNLQTIEFHAISCTAHKKICKSMGVHGYPKIKLFKSGAFQNATAEIPYWKLHPFDVLSVLNMDVAEAKLHANVDVLTDSGSNLQIDATARDTNAMVRTKHNIYDDAYRSFDFTMRNGVFVTDGGSLSNNTQTALRDMLELLQKTTPVVWDLHRVLRALLDNFDAIILSEERLVEVLDRHSNPPRHWSGSCTKGVAGMGYTCGLWELFHIMSVGVVEYNLMIGTNDHNIVEEMSVKTTHAAETLRNFVEFFFGCDECRYNFLQSYDACAFDRCNRLNDAKLDSNQWIQFPLWLFEVHNAVNRRLLRERAKRDNVEVTSLDEERSQWPPKASCKKCWIDTGGWNEENIFKYLRIEYWQEDYVSAEYRAEVGADKEFVIDAAVRPQETPLVLVMFVSLLSVMGYKSYVKVRSKRHSGYLKKFEDC